ncbi:hypothetical protein GP486_003429 [Trichoglossum hirsutum]|uniref:Ankyrin repeat protein n=1 Tax=Trichoglossum hirsutum TaxID=265104 RepID=A0A9P8LD46_9PEZI|nr:hypothetical protein GP486_003429 [Trichoglossum hirsutum]
MSLVVLVGTIASIGKEAAEFCRALEGAPEQLRSVSAKVTCFRSLLEQLQQICAELIENNQNLPPSELERLEGDVLAVKELFRNRKASPDDMTHDGWTPLAHAIESGSFELCEYLLDCGADPNSLFGTFQTTPLQWAFRQHMLDISRLLLRRGASVEELDARGWTCLFYLWSGRGKQTKPKTDFLKMISCDNVYSFRVLDSGGWSALHRAAGLGTAQDISLLVRYGARTNVQVPPLQWTPLHYATILQNGPVISELVSHFNVSVDTQDARGWAPLHIAAWCGAGPTMKLLLDLGANIYSLSKPSVFCVPKSLQNRSFIPYEAARDAGLDQCKAFVEALRHVKAKRTETYCKTEVGEDRLYIDGDTFWDTEEVL